MGALDAGADHDPRGVWVLRVALVIGLIIRLVVLSYTPTLGTEIDDEQHYVQLADNIITRHEFGLFPGVPTSLRPPLYPGLVALVWTVVGSHDLQAVRVVQIGLALATTVLVYAIGALLFNRRTGRYAAAIYWLYPTLLFFNFLILTETLFTFLFVASVYATLRLLQRPSLWWAVSSGAILAAAALTRSVLWPLPVLLCPLLAVILRGTPARRVLIPAALLATFVLVLTPWAIRNTRVQGVVTIVDAMGGINLRMGNYEYTPEDRMWAAVSLTGEKNWSYPLSQEFPGREFSEGWKDKWAQRKALEYMKAHPAITLRRSFIRFADFWGLEREFVAGINRGIFPVPQWIAIAVLVLQTIAYAAVVLLGAAGVWLLAPQNLRAHVVPLLPALVIVGAHTIVFGHSRYHLPIIPLLAVYASGMLTVRARQWNVSWVHVGAAGLSVAALVAIWVRQVALVDADRIRTLLQHVV